MIRVCPASLMCQSSTGLATVETKVFLMTLLLKWLLHCAIFHSLLWWPKIRIMLSLMSVNQSHFSIQREPIKRDLNIYQETKSLLNRAGAHVFLKFLIANLTKCHYVYPSLYCSYSSFIWKRRHTERVLHYMVKILSHQSDVRRVTFRWTRSRAVRRRPQTFHLFWTFWESLHTSAKNFVESSSNILFSSPRLVLVNHSLRSFAEFHSVNQKAYCRYQHISNRC